MKNPFLYLKCHVNIVKFTFESRPVRRQTSVVDRLELKKLKIVNNRLITRNKKFRHNILKLLKFNR